MAKCPYTWFRGLFGANVEKATAEARSLRVTVDRDGERKVDVELPSRSARWLIDLIPAEVVARIRAEGIPLDDMQAELARATRLAPGELFTLRETTRSVRVWLE